MRIKTPIPPLVFSFNTVDNLLDALTIIRSMDCKPTIYQIESHHCILLTPKFSKRQKLIIILCEFGNYLGSGQIFRAFLEEHGSLVPIKRNEGAQSLPLDHLL